MYDFRHFLNSMSTGAHEDSFWFSPRYINTEKQHRTMNRRSETQNKELGQQREQAQKKYHHTAIYSSTGS
jgi:hypothetical protein